MCCRQRWSNLMEMDLTDCTISESARHIASRLLNEKLGEIQKQMEYINKVKDHCTVKLCV